MMECIDQSLIDSSMLYQKEKGLRFMTNGNENAQWGLCMPTRSVKSTWRWNVKSIILLVRVLCRLRVVAVQKICGL